MLAKLKMYSSAIILFLLFFITGSMPVTGEDTYAVLEVNSTWTSLVSPNYENGVLLGDLTMTWSVTTEDPTKFILLETVDFDLDTNDYLEIYSNQNKYYFRGNNGPAMKSDDDYWKIILHTDPNTKGRGFQLLVRQASEFEGPKTEGCTMEITLADDAVAANIYNPQYPYSATKTTSCKWEVTAPANQRIKIQSKKFSFINCSFILSLSESWMRDEDLVKICGVEPFEFVTSGNTVTLRLYPGPDLHEPDQDEDRLWLSVQATNDPATFYGTCPDDRTGGALIEVTKEPGQLASKNYKYSDYDRNMDCLWRFHAPSGHVIRLMVLTSDIEMHAECRNDYVATYDGPDVGHPLLGRWCGKETPVVLSSGQYLTLTFHTDKDIQAPGFLLDYVAVPVLMAQTTQPPEVPESKGQSLLVVAVAVLATLLAVMCVILPIPFCRKWYRRRQQVDVGGQQEDHSIEDDSAADPTAQQPAPQDPEQSAMGGSAASVSAVDVVVSDASGGGRGGRRGGRGGRGDRGGRRDRGGRERTRYTSRL